MTDGAYRRIMSVNIDGVVFGTRALLPAMLDGRRADIVVTASMAGLGPIAFDPIYGLTKHAVVGFVRSMAGALDMRPGHDARISAICPGFTDTNILTPELKQRIGELGLEIMTPEHVGDAVMRARCASGSTARNGLSGPASTSPRTNGTRRCPSPRPRRERRRLSGLEPGGSRVPTQPTPVLRPAARRGTGVPAAMGRGSDHALRRCGADVAEQRLQPRRRGPRARTRRSGRQASPRPPRAAGRRRSSTSIRPTTPASAGSSARRSRRRRSSASDRASRRWSTSCSTAPRERGSFELIDELAFPVPFQVISELLDMPTERAVELRDWSQAITAALEPTATLADLDAAEAALGAPDPVPHRRSSRNGGRTSATTCCRRCWWSRRPATGSAPPS